jgi:hypothetical protein
VIYDEQETPSSVGMAGKPAKEVVAILLLTTTIVFVTVAYRIWLISRLNPAEVIKTE